MANTNTRKTTRALVEGAIMIALATILGFIRLYRFPFGGSVDLALIPILIYCLRWGPKWSLLCCFVNGVLQYVLGGGIAISWQSMLLDYLVAFTALGLGGVFRNRIQHNGVSLLCGSLVALGARYVAHILSGYILFSGYAEWFFTQDGFPAWGAQLVSSMSPEALGLTYSVVYNGMYMIPEMLLTAIAAFFLAKVPRIVQKVS